MTDSSGAALAANGAGAQLVVEGCEIYNNDPNIFTGVESPQILAGNLASLTVACSTIVEATASKAAVWAAGKRRARGAEAQALNSS